VLKCAANMKAQQDESLMFKPNFDVDIFAERILLGVLVGYPKEFLNKKFVEIVLEEQRPQGCWKPFFNESPGKRKLLKSGISDDECDHHASSLIAGVLAAYLKYQS